MTDILFRRMTKLFLIARSTFCFIADYVFKKISDYALLDLADKNTTATSAEMCQLICLSTAQCRSVNYFPSLGCCELNSKAWGDDETALNFEMAAKRAKYYYFCSYKPGSIKRPRVIERQILINT